VDGRAERRSEGIMRWQKIGSFKRLCALVALAVTLAVTFSRSAAAISPPPAESAEPTAAPAEPAQPSPWQMGPKRVDLGNDIAIELPAAYAFLPKAESAQLLEKNGSFHHEDLLGLVAGGDLSGDWFVVLRYEAEGYIKDDEEVDGAELLDSLREGTDAANEERKQKGFPALALDGWSDAPHYDKAKHHLIWGLIVSDPEGKSVNYNTRILGRRGFISLNLVTDPARLAEFKPHATALLGSTAFAQGARYEDFDEKNDKVAEYGLAGLVMAGAGLGAAKLVKLGLLAKFSKVIIAALIAGKKFIVIGLIALGVAVKKLFGGKQPA
jgi:uncharacterized membrane-anchored protein